jgi:hypothetical protein
LVIYRNSIDTGRIFENIVFLELRRRAEKIFYYRNKHEVDFYYILKGKRHLLNVSYDMDSSATREREISGLVEAMKRLGIKEGRIVTSEYEDLITTDKDRIYVIPLWKWLLMEH